MAALRRSLAEDDKRAAKAEPAPPAKSKTAKPAAPKAPANACLELELPKMGLTGLLGLLSLSLRRSRLRTAYFSNERYPHLPLRRLRGRRRCASFSLNFFLVVQDAAAVIPCVRRCGQLDLLRLDDPDSWPEIRSCKRLASRLAPQTRTKPEADTIAIVRTLDRKQATLIGASIAAALIVGLLGGVAGEWWLLTHPDISGMQCQDERGGRLCYPCASLPTQQPPPALKATH